MPLMPNQVQSTRLPTGSALHERVERGDFLDCYEVRSDLPVRQAAEIITNFPGWVRFLLLLRRAMTAPFGLSNDGPSAPNKIGAFPVELESSEEIVAGFNDKHLDFRVSILSRTGSIYLATWVHTHNLGGRLYLAGIMPFHIAIAKNSLRRVASQQDRLNEIG